MNSKMVIDVGLYEYVQVLHNVSSLPASSSGAGHTVQVQDEVRATPECCYVTLYVDSINNYFYTPVVITRSSFGLGWILLFLILQ